MFRFGKNIKLSFKKQHLSRLFMEVIFFIVQNKNKKPHFLATGSTVSMMCG